MNDPAFEAWSTHVRLCVAVNEQQLCEPDDDWVPVFLTENALGRVEVWPLIGLMETTATLGTVILPLIVRSAKAVRAALIVSAWTIRANKDDPAGAEALAAASRRELHAHPDSTETLLVAIAGRVQTELWMVPIERHENAPPTLGEWHDTASEPELADLTGTMLRWIGELRPQG